MKKKLKTHSDYLEYYRRYNKKRKKELRKYFKKEYKKNRLKRIKRISEYNKSKKGKLVRRKNLRTPKNRYRRAKYDTKRDGKVFYISFKEYARLISNPCYYCGMSLKDHYGSGLDRINNNKGYYKNNVLPCCGNCNKTRSDIYTVKEMKIMINALLKYRNNKCWKGEDKELVKLEEKK